MTIVTCEIRNSMTSLYSSRLALISYILWQLLDKIHYSKSSVSRVCKTHRNKFHIVRERLNKGPIHLLSFSVSQAYGTHRNKLSHC